MVDSVRYSQVLQIWESGRRSDDRGLQKYLSASTLQALPMACMICACLEKERPGCSRCYSGHGDAFVPHLRKVEHACQDSNHFPWQLPSEYGATVSRRPEICLHKLVEPLDFQRSKPRHDCTRQRCPSFGDRSRTQDSSKANGCNTALVSFLAFQNQPEIARYERMKPMDYTGVFTGLEADTIGLTSDSKAGITTLSRKPHQAILEAKTATHLHL